MSNLKKNIVRFTPPQVVHWGKCLVDADYRRQSHYLRQLRRYPRFQPVVTNSVESCAPPKLQLVTAGQGRR